MNYERQVLILKNGLWAKREQKQSISFLKIEWLNNTKKVCLKKVTQFRGKYKLSFFLKKYFCEIWLEFEKMHSRKNPFTNTY